MTTRTFWAAVAALVLIGSLSTEACADMIRLRDGQWLPKKFHDEMGDAPGPSDDLLARSGRNNLDLAYDKVTISGTTISAGLVDPDRIYVTTAYENESFRNGELQGEAGAFEEAADSFAHAAEDLKGAGREVAMWKRVAVLASAGEADRTFQATTELLEAFPKSFYFFPARIHLTKGKSKEAAAELDLVVKAPGMNPFHLFEAKLTKIDFFQLLAAGDDVTKIAAARAAYEQIAREISERTDAKTEAHVQYLKANVGAGRCLVYEQAYDKAFAVLTSVINDAASVQDRTLLARAYAGLGDTVYAQVKAELKGGNVAKEELPRIQEKLTTASLHYLRTSHFYVDVAGDERFPATAGLARVWATMFELGGDQDCELAKRAAKAYYEAHKLLPRGERKRVFTSEAKRFIDKQKTACASDDESGNVSDDDDRDSGRKGK